MYENKKLLSFIVPVYNAEKYLEECLDSLVTQDIPYEEYEIICIDDGSTDKSGEILDSYAEKYTNIVVVHKENSGVSSARNHGIDIAQSQYIWFVDSDDFIKKNCLHELKCYADEDYDIINFRAYKFNTSFTEEEQYLFDNNQIKANLKYWGFACFHLYKLDIIKKHKIRLIESIKYGEDEMFYNDMYEHSKNIIDLKNVYYFYRNNPSSAMYSVTKYENKVKQIHSLVDSMIIVKKGLESKQYTTDFTKAFLQKRYMLLYEHIIRLKLADAFTVLYKTKAMKLFIFDDSFDWTVPTKRAFIVEYLKRHTKIWVEATAKRIVPDFLVKILKKCYPKKTKM